MDWEGIFLITASSSLRTPDRVFIDSFALYNLEEKVSEAHNQHYHDAHKKKALHDTAQMDITHHTRDLIHSRESFFNKEQFGEENLYDMLP